jgi:hypothetical protein
MTRIFLVILLIVFSCFIGIAMSKKVVRQPHRAPLASCPITRSSDASSILPTALETEPLPSYPWESNKKGRISLITKEYFRCKGSSLNSPIPIILDGKVIENLFDCHGADTHSLPIRHEKEFIYPILLELVNEIQSSTGKPVIITSGHRCPAHNRYVDLSPKNQGSKHLIGAEVSFYVAELERNPEVILNTIFAFYRSNPRYAAEGKAYTEFERYDKEVDVSTKPWINKEILIKIFLPHEGRNGDNRHPFPYFSIQVRFDKDTNMRVAYSPADAQHFLRR